MFNKIYNFFKGIYDFLFNNIMKRPPSTKLMHREPDYTNEIKEGDLYTTHKVYIKGRPRSLRSGSRSDKYYQKILLRKRKPTEFSKTVEYVKIPKRKR